MYIYIYTHVYNIRYFYIPYSRNMTVSTYPSGRRDTAPQHMATWPRLCDDSYMKFPCVSLHHTDTPAGLSSVESLAGRASLTFSLSLSLPSMTIRFTSIHQHINTHTCRVFFRLKPLQTLRAMRMSMHVCYYVFVYTNTFIYIYNTYSTTYANL